MAVLTRLLLLLLLLFAVPAAHAAPVRHYPFVTAPERALLARIDVLAARDPAAAAAWLRRRSVILSAQMGPASGTLLVRFRDGAQVVILPRRTVRSGAGARMPLESTPQPGSAAHRALVLEPFAWEAGMDPTDGTTEVAALKAAGFSVDEYRNSAVTVEVMQHLADYGVIYMQTHANIISGGDAVIATGVTDTAPYAQMFIEGSLRQVMAAGDPKARLFDAIDTRFIQGHVGTFPNGAIMVVNGCSLLDATELWNALRGRNLATMVGWDNEGLSAAETQAGNVLFTDLAGGDTVAGAVAAVTASGWGTNDAGSGPAHLGYDGSGLATLSGLEKGMLPSDLAVTPSPTPLPPTATTVPPTAAPTASKRHACPRGKHRSHGKCVRKKRAKRTKP